MGTGDRRIQRGGAATNALMAILGGPIRTSHAVPAAPRPSGPPVLKTGQGQLPLRPPDEIAARLDDSRRPPARSWLAWEVFGRLSILRASPAILIDSRLHSSVHLRRPSSTPATASRRRPARSISWSQRREPQGGARAGLLDPASPVVTILRNCGPWPHSPSGTQERPRRTARAPARGGNARTRPSG
jgi:hypothetical protein